MIEKGRIGGAGLHNGALSSKTMWEISEDFKRLIQNKSGFSVDLVNLDYNEVKKDVFEAQHTKEYQMKRQLEALKIPVFKGVGKFITPELCRVETDVDILDIKANYFVIATGSIF
jgi:dihydrolipoamide dehydrogenase